MSKHTITRLFAGSLISVVGGLALLFAVGGLAYANGGFVMDGPDIVGVHATAVGWALLGVAGLAAVLVVAAVIVQFVAWVAALLNAAQLPDKTWFAVLLATGLLSFGLLGMIVYLIAAPDAHRPAPPRRHHFPHARAA